MVSKKRRYSPKLRVIFRPKSKIQRFFPPQIRWSPKKKKVFTEIESDFSSNFANSNVSGGAVFLWGGGYFQFFTKNRPQKHQKHAILHTSQANGGLDPPPRPPPGYATAGRSIHVPKRSPSQISLKRSNVLYGL